MSEDRRKPDATLPEDIQFFRRYDVRLYNHTLAAEFDYGFLSPSKMVLHVHNHAAVELIAVSNGIHVIEAMETTYSCEEGSVLLIPQGVYHTNRPIASPAERFCFRIQLKGEGPHGRLEPFAELLADMQTPQKLHLPDLLPILVKIRDEMLCEAPASEEMIPALLKEIYILLLRYTIRQKVSNSSQQFFMEKHSSLEQERIKKIERFFSRRYTSPVTLKDLAEELYISPSQTNRILLANYGQSFRDKLRDTRLHQAKLLLERTERSISVIAGEVGYASVAGFFAAFRKTFGITPTEYRRKSNL